MVKRFFQFIHKEISGLHQAAYLLAVFALLADILGLLRDRLLAHTLGAGPTLDMYYAAFRVPDFLFSTVASAVSLSVLIPLLVEKLGSEKREGKDFLNTVFSFFFIVMIAVDAVAFALMPIIDAHIFPGITDQAKLVMLSRILLLSPILLGLSNLFGSVTQTFKRFFIYATSPLLYNVGIIVGVIYMYPRWGITGVVWGVIIGAVMHCAFQIPFVWSKGLLPRFAAPDWKEIRQIMYLSLPRTVALSITQISMIFILGLASLMTAGSISIFNLAYNLDSVPLSIIGVSYSLAAFPTLAKLFSSGNRTRFVEYIAAAARHIVFWSMPLTVLFIVLRAHIVRVILGSGQFGWTQTRLTAAALGLFVLSSVFQSLILLFVRGYYSAGKTKEPLIINAVSGGLTIALCYVFAWAFGAFPTFQYFIEALFRVEGIPGTEMLMLPLGFTVGSAINGVWLWWRFDRDFGGFSKSLYRPFFQSVSTAVIMGFVTYACLIPLSAVFGDSTTLGILIEGAGAGVAGIIAGIILLKLMHNAEIAEIWKALHNKIWKAKTVVGPDPKVLQ